MNEPANRADGSWAALIQTPLEVVRLLKDDKILLTGMGAAVLLALIAIFGPGGGQVYAALIAGLVVVLVIIRAVVSRPGSTGRVDLFAQGRPDQANQMLQDHSHLSNVTQEAVGGGGNFIASRHSRMKNIVQRTGTAKADDPKPDGR